VQMTLAIQTPPSMTKPPPPPPPTTTTTKIPVSPTTGNPQEHHHRGYTKGGALQGTLARKDIQDPIQETRSSGKRSRGAP
jgi:hypothetical protein